MKFFTAFISLVFFVFLFAEESKTDIQKNSKKSDSEVPSEAQAEPDVVPVSVGVKAESSEAVNAKPAETHPVGETQAENPSKKSENISVDEQGYNLKLRALEEKVNSLKDKIFRSKQRLAILQETVLNGTITGSSVAIIHKNTVNSLFQLTTAVYYFDDKPVFKKVNLPAELSEEKFLIYDASVIPGPHHISAYYVFTGKGYGVFSYMKDYSIKLNAGYSFTVEEGNLIEVVVSAKDKGASHKIDNRLYITFDMNKKDFESSEAEEEQTTTTKEE